MVSNSVVFAVEAFSRDWVTSITVSMTLKRKKKCQNTFVKLLTEINIFVFTLTRDTEAAVWTGMSPEMTRCAILARSSLIVNRAIALFHSHSNIGVVRKLLDSDIHGY